MRRWIFFAYGLACHGLFLGVYAWMAAFVGNFGFGVLPTIDGPAEDPFWKAFLIDVLLVAIFAAQHSVMARPWFKGRWTRIIPEPIERSTYVLASCAAVALLMWQWRPIGGVVWDVTDPVWRTILQGVFIFGWVMVPAVSLLINHFDLFGTRQVYLHLRGRAYTNLPFRTPGIYRHVRHPLYVGWIIAFWATPTMTATHLLFAAFLTLYILAAIPFEEKDLVSHFGDVYRDYRRRAGALAPRLGASRVG
ncbi:MAG: isoprenylcysteine carboxylmethyltransferase family protein [Phycisphaeraceae bacterium]|mgnify:CR=1 FL=1|nr:isoprenylcysteine carboxylmethyltransferase family protein [Phycisphaerae bacterium]MBX3392589.1 isoprenylcysteine carboxylmethyltransferase family protein [Phycisphaeraceae bacterium]HRJ48932.1 isoprenylcysteine carboxylmethyltransferase family protein [Phycisphaerales bacterium]